MDGTAASASARLARTTPEGVRTDMSTTETSASRTQLDAYLSELEQMWSAFDEVYGSLSRAQWSKKYGKDWTFADQPYHLASFDREIGAARMDARTVLPARAR